MWEDNKEKLYLIDWKFISHTQFPNKNVHLLKYSLCMFFGKYSTQSIRLSYSSSAYIQYDIEDWTPSQICITLLYTVLKHHEQSLCVSAVLEISVPIELCKLQNEELNRVGITVIISKLAINSRIYGVTYTTK
jgi:hypothetical protein